MVTVMELIRKLRSPDNKVVLQAVEELRVRGWLTDGSLEGVSLCHAHLQGADLLKASLRKVDLHQANLEWADLSIADLSGAKLARVNLQGANLSQTNLSGADLYKADLKEARNLTDAQLSQVKRLWGVIMPDGEPYDGRFNLEGDIDFARWGHIEVDNPAAMANFFGIPLQTYLRGQGKTVEAYLSGE
ncbi:MAG: pentapeptide repeat-containing protein [Anaerolineales bacterium]|nr:pentapeptide repeat-containing protein [Anaerolineales bacterium]